MARSVKKQRNKDSSKFKDAVEASAQKDALEGTGVVHEDGGPVHLVRLNEQDRAAAGEHLADKLARLAAVEQDYKDTAAKFRKDIKERKKQIAELRDEVISGMRKEDAQPHLPGVNGVQVAHVGAVLEDTTLTEADE